MILLAFVGNIQMDGNIIRDSSLDTHIMSLTTTVSNINNFTITNCTNSKKWRAIFHSNIDAVFNLTNVLVEDSRILPFMFRNSELYCKNFTFRGLVSPSRAMSLYYMKNMTIENM